MKSSETIKIEKNIPLKPWSRWFDLFKKMKVGDSFLVEKESYRKDAVSAASRYRNRSKSGNKNFNVATRKVEGGFRIWRIK